MDFLRSLVLHTSDKTLMFSMSIGVIATGGLVRTLDNLEPLRTQLNHRNCGMRRIGGETSSSFAFDLLS